MSGKYTDAQKKASLDYQRKMAQLKITVTKEERDLYQKHANKKGVTLTTLIKELLDKDMKKQ